MPQLKQLLMKSYGSNIASIIST